MIRFIRVNFFKIESIFQLARVFCVLVFIGGVNLSGNSNSALPSPQHQLGAI